MNKRDFFLQAVRAGRLKGKSWILRAFSLVKPSDMREPVSFDIQYITDGDHSKLVMLDDQLNMVELSDYQYLYDKPEPPFHIKDKITLNPGDLPNVKSKIETTYGNVIANWLLLVYPFNDKIEFIVGKFSIKDVEKHIEEKLVNEPKSGSRDSNAIYNDEYNRYRKAAGMIDGLSQLCVPSATPKSMTHHPDRDKVRAELIEKYKDRLHDPAVVAKIDQAMVDLDHEWLKDDDFQGFLIQGKTMKVVRKKAHGLMGLEQAFQESGGEFMPKSLQEGWDITKLAAMANSTREGSFDRGAETALGGEAVKFILRVMQNVVIEEDNCGTRLGTDAIINKENANQYIGNYLIISGKDVLITDDNVSQFFGKTVIMRTPLFCRTERDSFCKKCIGERYAPHETSLATAAANVGSIFMDVFMGSMHGKSLSTAKYDVKSSLT